jgi:hypothetical protein
MDVRDEQLALWRRTFPSGKQIFEGKDPWIIWGVVDCNKRAAVIKTRLHDGQLRASWADLLNRKINDPERKWTDETFDPLTLIREAEGA